MGSGEIDVVMVLTRAGGKLLGLSPTANGGHRFIRRLAFGLIGFFEDGRSKIGRKLTGRRGQATRVLLLGGMLLV